MECGMPNAPDEPPVAHILDDDAALRSTLADVVRMAGTLKDRTH
jgi:hypothetical protein